MQEPQQPIPRERSTDLNQLALKFTLGGFMVEFLGWGFIPAEYWRNYLHVHTYFEICYAFAGRGTFRMKGVDYPVAKGDVFIAKPTEEHEILSSEDEPLGIYFWSHTLVPQGTGHKSVGDQEATGRLLLDYLTSSSWVSSRVPGMQHTLELMTEEIVRKEPGFTSTIEGLAKKLVLDTARAAVGEPRAGETPVSRAPSAAHALCAQAKRYIRDNYGTIQSVREIAAQVNVSERHLNRLFGQIMGKSCGEELITVRMEMAAQMLLDPTLPIKEIASRTGFSDIRYFTTAFRKYSGFPPAKYRETRGTRFTDPALNDPNVRKMKAEAAKSNPPGHPRNLKLRI